MRVFRWKSARTPPVISINQEKIVISKTTFPLKMQTVHTSILATLRDWLNLNVDPTKFLPSPRITAAPTLDRVLTRAKGNEATWPNILAKCTIDSSDTSPDTPLNDVQKSLIVATKVLNQGADQVPTAKLVKNLQTYAHGASFLAAKSSGVETQ